MGRILALLLVVAMIAGCAQNLYVQGRKQVEQGQYDQGIETLYSEIARNPQNAEAWREIGVAFYQKGDYLKSEDALKQANAIKPDSRANLYLGLGYEKQGMIDQAMAAYTTSLSLKPGGKTKDLLLGHLNQLVGVKINHEVSAALANESSINVDTIPTNTIAVADFDASYLSPDLAPLARGLAEFTSSDLSKVHSLRVIDRLKIDAIMDELKLSRTGYVDPSSAPRVGKLLGSSKLVTATVLGVGEDQVRLDGAIVSTADSAAERTAPAEGQLNKIFAVEKAFVFSVIKDLGITLTAAERDSISTVPTESYLAFLAYSKGLDYQRRGMYKEAESSFRSAAKADPGFSAASAKAAVMSGALSMGGGAPSTSSFEAAVQSVDVTQIASQLATNLTLISTDLGLIQNLHFQKPVLKPPVVRGTGTVVIQGDLDAK